MDDKAKMAANNYDVAVNTLQNVMGMALQTMSGTLQYFANRADQFEKENEDLKARLEKYEPKGPRP